LPALPDLRAVVGDVPIEVETSEIPDDWADRWRDFHEPAVIAAGRLVVQPSWIEQEPQPQAGEPAISVVIDPGQAFGTGAHATTRLSLELLLVLADAGHASGPIVDLGTGSAVLAIAAAKLGWDPVAAVDHEEAAVAAARENARLNGVEATIDRLNLRQSPPPTAPTVVANLTAPLLKIVAAWWAADASLTPDRMVCSGLLLSEADEVIEAFRACGLAEAERRAGGEWGGLRFERAY
jgi:ribosomal protein L11 methyltransferase